MRSGGGKTGTDISSTITNCDAASHVDSRQREQSVSRGERRYMCSMAACNIVREGYCVATGQLTLRPLSTARFPPTVTPCCRKVLQSVAHLKDLVRVGHLRRPYSPSSQLSGHSQLVCITVQPPSPNPQVKRALTSRACPTPSSWA